MPIKMTPDEEKDFNKLKKQYEERGYRTTGAERAENVIKRRQEEEAERRKKEAQRDAERNKKK